MMRFLTFILLLSAFTAVGPRPAQACIPGLQPLCDIIGAEALLNAVTSRVKIYVDTMLYKLKLQSTQKYAQSIALLEKEGARATALRADQRQLRPAIQGTRCMISGAYRTALFGSQKTDESMKNAATALPSGMQPAATKAADAKAVAARRVYIPLPKMTDDKGEPLPVGAELGGPGTGDMDPEAYRRAIVRGAEKIRSDRRQNKPASASDQFRDAANRYAYRMNNYDVDQANGEDKTFVNADISAVTILSQDTYSPTLVNKGKRTYTVGNKTVTQEKNLTLFDAAMDYCTQLVDPTILGPNRGAALGQDQGRKGYAVQRAGWDARLSLASTVCSNIVAIRAPRKIENDTAQGLLKIAMDYRKDACAAKAQLQNVGYLECTDATSASKTISKTASKEEIAKAAATAATDADVYGARFSEHELLKILYSRLLPSLQGAALLGASGNTDTLGNLLTVDQLALSLNYKIYELQEQMNLIKAAQLAQQVENTKTSPGASAPSQ